jgi:hypothetical protein
MRRSVQRKDGTVIDAEIRASKISSTRYMAIIETVASRPT